MHSHDRTLLANLGFADPDKKDRRHDLACQYLALPENHRRILAHLWGDKAAMPKDKGYFHPTFEKPITKGEGQYRTTIGFVDLVLNFMQPWEYEDGSTRWSYSRLSVEVKIKPVGVGDVLRQIGLYKQYASDACWLVATAYPLTPLDVAALRTANVRHIRLGPAFEEWAAAQSSQALETDDAEAIFI